MDHKTVEEYILTMPSTKLDYPFGEEVAVYKAFISSKAPIAAGFDGVQGNNEERAKRTSRTTSEPHKQLTQQSAKSSDSVSGSAGGQVSAPRGEWKMFALIQEGKDPLRISLKCDPLLSELLRNKYDTVMAGYHLNKKHWNTIVLTGELDEEEVKALIKHSYSLVIDDKAATPSFN